MIIVNSTTSPVIGRNVTALNMSPIPYNPSRIFYEPVPFEFLSTNEVTPQLIVSVGGLEAICSSLSCGYSYIPPTAQITGFSLIGNSLTITGTLFPI